IFFFFQAEDGIRDDLVTGVQTCALPISTNISSGMRPSVRTGGNGFVMDFFSLRKTTACQAAPAMTRRRPSGAAVNPKRGPFSARSEERRVGKEGRCRRWTEDEKKKRECK